MPALEPLKRPQWHSMSAPDMRAELASRGKCSALVKVTGDSSVRIDTLYTIPFRKSART